MKRFAMCVLLAATLPAAAANRAFNVTAHKFSFDITPQPFTVNQGDIVTLTITATDDGKGDGHGIRMEPYITGSHPLHPGSPVTKFLTPTRGTASGGTQVTIRGAGFSTAVGLALTFGGAPATDITVIDAITLSAHTPAHAAGGADVVITTNKGSTTSAGGYTFAAEKRRTSRH